MVPVLQGTGQSAIVISIKWRIVLESTASLEFYITIPLLSALKDL
jgi:hypothetical protein